MCSVLLGDTLGKIIVFLSIQEKGDIEQWDELECEKAFVRTMESVYRQN